ncbi:MAG: CDP-alcohol phosphatidyltransferase family protein [Proteobacteria bacterium]|nr:CDP-alcohol phosphatidyltransferase family protein [Burkholderiales bacterium]
MVRPDPHKVAKIESRRRGIYWLPNAFTTAALFAGFFAIVQAMNGRYETAAMAIFVAAILDGLDGRVARWTRTQSAFGAEYDSLSDMVSFGVAPALVVYVWALRDFSQLGELGNQSHWLLGRLGWIAAFIYCACAALRLARFNTQLDVADKRYFTGLPSPAAAGLVASLVWAFSLYQVEGGDVKWLAWIVTVFAGFSMVSNFKFYSGKDINLRKPVSFPVVVGMAIGVGLLSLVADTLAELLLAVSLLYALSGYVMALLRMRGSRASVPGVARVDPNANPPSSATPDPAANATARRDPDADSPSAPTDKSPPG